MNLSEFRAFIQEPSNGYAKSLLVGDWRYETTLTNSRFFEDSTDGKAGGDIRVMVKIANVKSNMSILKMVPKTTAEFAELQRYYTYFAEADAFITYDDTNRIMPALYLFEPSDGLRNYDLIQYGFSIDEIELDNIKEDERIKFTIVDRVLGHGVLHFSYKLDHIKKLNDIKVI